MLEIVLVGIVLFIASIIDIKTEEVPDWLSFGLMGVGIVYSIYLSFMQQTFTPLINSLIALAILFVGGYILYRTGQWGGGDTKLIAGVGALFGITNSFLHAFLLNILIAGGIWGILFTLYIMIKKRYTYKKPIGFYPTAIVFLVASIYLLVKETILGIFLLLIFFIYLMIPLLRDTHNLMRKDQPVSKLVEGDWLLKPVVVKGKTIVSVKKIGLTAEDIAALKKHRVKKVVLKQGMPFVPSFFIAYVLTVSVGNIFLVLATL